MPIAEMRELIIISSARSCIELGTKSPRALAVPTLMTTQLGRLQDGQFRRIFAPQDATGVDANLTKHVRDARPIADQAASNDIIAH